MPLHCWDRAYIHTHQSCRSGSWAHLSAEHSIKKQNSTPTGKATTAKKASRQPVSRTAATAASCAGNTGPDPQPGSAPTQPALPWGCWDTRAPCGGLGRAAQSSTAQTGQQTSSCSAPRGTDRVLPGGLCPRKLQLLHWVMPGASSSTWAKMGGGGKIHHGSFSKPH